MRNPLIVYWSRRDFRLRDNPALISAIKESTANGIPLLPLFILEDYMVEAWPESQFGYPSRWLLAHALPEFGKQFPTFAVVRGKAVAYLAQLGAEYELTVFVNDDVYPDFRIQVKKLEQAGVHITVCSDALTVSPETRTGEGNTYSVFTSFKKAVWATFVNARPLPLVDTTTIYYAAVSLVEALPQRVALDSQILFDIFSHTRLLKVGEHIIDLDELVPLPNLDGWYVNEEAALDRFRKFLAYELMTTYDSERDSLEGDTQLISSPDGVLQGKTSRMSLALAWGLVSPRTLMQLVREHFDESFDNPYSKRVNQGALSYVSELIWREFYRYLFFHDPSLMDMEFQKRFRGTIAWVPDAIAYERFCAWIKGETGYPIVDAAMRQIAAHGWMHNRARMIVASVLTKNLGVDWRWGQEYFRAALIDLDEASNNGGWQWGASVGADPKPIRIFNPELQAKNYDGSGAYRNTWRRRGGSFMETEIVPLIEHKVAREEALRRYGLPNTKPPME